MQLNLENINKHTIQAYNDSELKINNEIYTHNLLICEEGILSDWSLTHVRALTIADLDFILPSKPEIILIGHNYLNEFIPALVVHHFSQKRIALESMSIGAACRTFNVLLSEGRRAALGILLTPADEPLER